MTRTETPRTPLPKPERTRPPRRDVASIVLVNTGDGFTWESEDLGRSAVIAREAWSAAEDTPSSGRYDLLVLDLADTVTEMRKVKHAYETGVRAKRGIDF